jgi:sigma-B regulation protein RsbU (phosphoserine phosphatase)
VLGSDIDPTGPILSEPSTEHRAPSTLSSEHRAPSTVLAPPLAARESLLVRRLQKSGRPVGTYDVEAHSAEAILTLADRELARRLGAVLWLPIMLRDSLVGMLALGWKASEEIYTEEELDALCLIASEAAVALENAAFSEQRAQQARLQQEVAIARSIQMRLLPATRLCLEGCEVLSRSEPAAEVGGDFYNVFEVGRPSGKEGERKRDGGAEGVGPGPGEGEKGDRAGDPLTARPAQPVSPSLPLSLPPSTTRLGVLLGDVSGKGVPGALFMAVTTTLVEAQARLLSSPAETLAAANAQLHPKMRHPGDGHPPMFATAVYGILDTQRREIRLANAGQTPPIHWPAGGTPRYIRLTGVPLGALSGSTYAEATVVLAPGDRLLLCSDGFIEATDDAGQPVGYTGFLRRVAALGDRSGPELIEALFAAEPAISDDGPDRDDRTLVLITVR